MEIRLADKICIKEIKEVQKVMNNALKTFTLIS